MEFLFTHCRYKSFEKAFSLAIDINDADLFMILFKCAKAHGIEEMAEESLKKADEIYAKEENDSHREFYGLESLDKASYLPSHSQIQLAQLLHARFAPTLVTLRLILMPASIQAMLRNHQIILTPPTRTSFVKITTEAQLGD